MEKPEPLCTAAENEKWCSYYENNMTVPFKIKYRTSIWSNNSTTKYIPKRTGNSDSNTYLYTKVDSGIIHNSQKNREKIKCPSTDEWINKKYVYVHTIQRNITQF